MNTRIVRGLLAASLLAAMLGCSSQRAETEPPISTTASENLPISMARTPQLLPVTGHWLPYLPARVKGQWLPLPLAPGDSLVLSFAQISGSPPFERRKGDVNGHFCQLGKSCMALDPRPFEACLLSTTHCKDKATEPLLVDSPQELALPPVTIRTAVKPGHD
jgi:hypothetical protein